VTTQFELDAAANRLTGAKNLTPERHLSLPAFGK
jgi:hypothetical protein